MAKFSDIPRCLWESSQCLLVIFAAWHVANVSSLTLQSIVKKLRPVEITLTSHSSSFHPSSLLNFFPALQCNSLCSIPSLKCLYRCSLSALMIFLWRLDSCPTLLATLAPALGLHEKRSTFSQLSQSGLLSHLLTLSEVLFDELSISSP